MKFKLFFALFVFLSICCVKSFAFVTFPSATLQIDKNEITVGFIGTAGGYVFYDCDADNESGNADGLISSECGWRYLEAAPADVRYVNGKPSCDVNASGYNSADKEYIFGYYRKSKNGDNLYVNGTTSYNESDCTTTATGMGKKNTEMLVKAMGDKAYTQPTGTATDIYAAKLCDDLVYNGYDDWFLPSDEELTLMYENLHKKGKGSFASDSYWSSSENLLQERWIKWYRQIKELNHFLTSI